MPSFTVTQEEWEQASAALLGMATGTKIKRKQRDTGHSFFTIENKLLAMANSKIEPSLLGSGSFGKVKLAKDQDGNFYAIKILTKNSSYSLPDSTMEEEISSDVGILMGYAKKSYVGENCNKHQDSLVFVLTYLGENFFNKFVKKNKNIPLTLAINMLTEIHKLHEGKLSQKTGKKYLHCDLKLENIMLDNKNKVTLIDFGLSREPANAKQTKELVGTLLYLAPEIYNSGLYTYSTASDIYAIIKSLLIAELTYLGLYQKLILPSRLESWNLRIESVNKQINEMIQIAATDPRSLYCRHPYLTSVVTGKMGDQPSLPELINYMKTQIPLLSLSNLIKRREEEDNKVNKHAFFEKMNHWKPVTTGLQKLSTLMEKNEHHNQTHAFNLLKENYAIHKFEIITQNSFNLSSGFELIDSKKQSIHFSNDFEIINSAYNNSK